ncbi:MAG: translesion error-prone DNA polymerase V autoproteolytic subunit [Muribaculaceae bacterium]|nr:translesion error-prone DNA polymerase V autoproteolytic subunit [Muribaculaceae bacterium]
MKRGEIMIHILRPELTGQVRLPLADMGIQAGFPSPAQDYLSEAIDLNHELVQHPASTFYARVSGESMIGDGIEDGDLLVIDRSLEPKDGDMAVCCIDGEFTLKRLSLVKDQVWLVPSNESFDPILVTPDREFEVWGVVTHSIKQHRRNRSKKRKTDE